MPVVYLDSNIYRKMGLKFKENRDYNNLLNTLEFTAANFGLLEVVLSELLDFYKFDVFANLIIEHENLLKKYEANPYIENQWISIPPPPVEIALGIKKIEADMKAEAILAPLPTSFPSQFLLEFCLEVKRSGSKKDNTRDFLIFYTLMQECMDSRSYGGDYIILISEDKIFSTNIYFKSLLVVYKIYNFKTYDSIASFLSDYGPKLDYITSSTILQAIESSIIEIELLKDIKCLPSYISGFYNGKVDSRIPSLENLEIKEIQLSNYYIFKNFKSESLYVHAAFTVFVKAVFQPDSNLHEIISYVTSSESFMDSTYSNTFDKDGRPIYDSAILFTFEGKINTDEQVIEELTFIDFIPDYFVYAGYKKRYSKEEFFQMHHSK